MIKLYDDFHAIEKACKQLEILPFGRTVPYSISCLVGENVEIVRYISLAFIFINIFLVFKLYNRQFGELKDNFYFFLSPVILLPFFYPTLLSLNLSLTVAFHWLLLDKKNKLSWFNTLLISVIAFFIRKEAFLLIIGIVGFDFFIKYLEGIKLIEFFSVKKNKQILILVVTSFVLNFGLKDGHPFTEKIIAVESSYPFEDHIFIQMWSSVLYLKNLILPFSMSFYGDFHQWWDVSQSSWLKAALVVSMVLPIFLLIIIKSKKYKALLFSIICVMWGSYILSFKQSTDWYYLSRSWIPSFYGMTFLLISLKNFYKIKIALSGIFMLSTIYHVTMHFSSVQNFYLFEKKWNDTPHPIVFERVFNLFYAFGDYEKSLKALNKQVSGFSDEMVSKSQRAKYFWAKNSYNKFVLYLNKDKKEEAGLEYLKLTQKSKSLFSLLSCLQLENKCNTYNQWNKELCGIINGKNIHHQYRIFNNDAIDEFYNLKCNKYK